MHTVSYPLLLHSSRNRDPRTGKWRLPRYKAELHEIREQHGDDFEIAGADGDPRPD